MEHTGEEKQGRGVGETNVWRSELNVDLLEDQERHGSRMWKQICHPCQEEMEKECCEGEVHPYR